MQSLSDGIQEVSGSIPLVSTKKYRKRSVFGTFYLFYKRKVDENFGARAVLESGCGQKVQ
jgi:hypothetical protein